MNYDKYIKTRLIRIIREYDRDKHKNTDLGEWAKIYGRRVFWRTLDRHAAKSAKDGFIIGFLYARFLEGY